MAREDPVEGPRGRERTEAEKRAYGVREGGKEKQGRKDWSTSVWWCGRSKKARPLARGLALLGRLERADPSEGVLVTDARGPIEGSSICSSDQGSRPRIGGSGERRPWRRTESDVEELRESLSAVGFFVSEEGLPN